MLSKNIRNDLSTSNCPIKYFFKSPRFNDEPLLYQYNAFFKEQNDYEWGGGISFSRKKAIEKAFGEGLERYSLGKRDNKRLVNLKTKDIKRKFLNPLSIVSFSEKMRKQYPKKLKINNSSIFSWIEGNNLINDERVLIPAQLVYVPYNLNKEPIIRLPISTGAALGETKEWALYRGLCEVVERDSFMIFYLNKITPIEIKLSSCGKSLAKIFQYYKRYKLDLRIFDITSDINIPVIMAVIIDETGIGPRISIGLKCSLDRINAIEGSIEEAQHVRVWMRDEISKTKKEDLIKINSLPKNLSDPKERGLFWYKKDPKELDFWLKMNKNRKFMKFIKGYKHAKNEDHNLLKKVISRIQKHNYKAYYVDITPPEVVQFGYRVVKVIIPELQPLYLDERYKYLGGRRLYNVPVKMGYLDNCKTEEELNKKPHPFL